MDVNIDRRQRGSGIDLVVRGRLDAASAGELGRAVEESMRQGLHEIALDLTDVVFLSSAGIRELLTAHRNAKTAGGRCMVIAASEPVRQVLELTRLSPLLFSGSTADPAPPRTAGRSEASRQLGSVIFTGLEPAAGRAVEARLVGGIEQALGGDAAKGVRRAIPGNSCGLGLGSLDDDGPATARAGELAAVAGAVFHRPPQPCAVVDYLVSEAAFVPHARLLSGLVWKGLPTGRAGFTPAGDEPAVKLDELAARVLEWADSDAVAVVIAAEVHGLVGAELIRPLSEATATDGPRSTAREVAARWLSFSREPVHGRRTALVVGVATKGVRGPAALQPFVRPLGPGGVKGHLHAVVFPHRPLKRGPVDLVATVSDLTASQPLAVMHLLADPQPVLGSGQSEFVHGCCWFAPVNVAATEEGDEA